MMLSMPLVPEHIQEIKVFISSPSDVAEERRLFKEVVERLNALYIKQRRDVRLTPVDWRMYAYPSAATEYTQATITEQLGSYDIYVGVMAARFGSPTAKAASGTEEEFNDAYDRFRQEPRSIRIMFYFKDLPSSASYDEQQLSQVKAFRKRLRSLQVLEWSYSTPDSFTLWLFGHLAHHVEEWGKSWGRVDLPERQVNVSHPQIRNIEPDNVSPASSPTSHTDNTTSLEPEQHLADMQVSGQVLSDASKRLTKRVRETNRAFGLLQRQIRRAKSDEESTVATTRLRSEVIQYISWLDAELDVIIPAYTKGIKSIIYSIPSWNTLTAADLQRAGGAVTAIMSIEPKLLALQNKIEEGRKAVPRWPSYLEDIKPRAQALLEKMSVDLVQATSFASEATKALEPITRQVILAGGFRRRNLILVTLQSLASLIRRVIGG
jgi:hypothetical protein